MAQAPSFLQLSEDVGSLDPERVFGDLNLDVCTLEFNEHPVYMDDYTYMCIYILIQLNYDLFCIVETTHQHVSLRRNLEMHRGARRAVQSGP